MRVRHAEPIPRSFSHHPAGKKILAECDIFIHACGRDRPGRLATKLLVFATEKDMATFSKRGLGVNNDNAGAFVHELGYTRMKFLRGGREVATRFVDPRYVSVMALCQENLGMEIITHEAVHAGFFYARRTRQKWPNQDDCEDEAVCYPAGRIAAAVNRFLHAKGLYK